MVGAPWTSFTLLLANKARRPFSLDYRLRRHDGEYRWAIDAGRPRVGSNGEFLGYIGSVLDISDRVSAEEALRASEQETKRARDYAEATLRTSPVPLLVLEHDFRVHTANDAFYHTFQVNPAETHGRLVYELGNGQWNIPKLRELLERILPQHTVFTNFEVTHKFESIGHRTMLLHARRMDNDSERSERMVLVIEDITERKRAEKALLDAKGYAESIISGSPFGLYVVDADFRIAQVNTDALNGAFINVRPVIGRSFDEAVRILWPQDVAEKVIQIFRQTLETGEPYYSKDFINPRRDTEQIEGYEWQLRRIAMPDGRPGVVCYYFDSTALRESERHLRESEEKLRSFAQQLEQRVAERTQELAQSEDRLRTLATELNLAEQRERKRLATELHDHLQQTLVLGRLIVGQGKRVAAAVPGTLDVLKKLDDIFSETLTYTRTLVADLSPPVLREHGLPAGLKWLGEYMKRHEITVTVIVPEEHLQLPEDQAVLLFQSVRELLINSSKHAGTRQASVRLEWNDRHLRIEVSDRGKGFDLAAAASAGTPSGSISSKFGLFSVQERMRALGGSFEVESAPGKGTTATLVLPLPCRVEDKVLHAKSPGTAKVQSKHSALQKNGPIRVLLVDDHTMMRQGLRSIVTAYDHFEVVGEAGDGAEAVELAQRLNPDVVVMDINMPKMDGITATQRIKANQPAIVVIGLSVNQSADTEQKMVVLTRSELKR